MTTNQRTALVEELGSASGGVDRGVARRTWRLGSGASLIQEREAGRSYFCRRSTRGGPYEMRKTRLQILDRVPSKVQTIKQISVSLITLKSRWYKPGYDISSLLIRCSHLVRMCWQLTIYSFRHLQLPNRPVQLRHSSRRKQLLLLVVIPVLRARPLESSSATAESVTREYEMNRMDRVRKEQAGQEGHSRHTPTARPSIIDYL